jgi:hypothetical protein
VIRGRKATLSSGVANQSFSDAEELKDILLVLIAKSILRQLRSECTSQGLATQVILRSFSLIFPHLLEKEGYQL